MIDDFFRERQDAAIPLILINSQDWPLLCEQLSDIEKRILNHMGFSGQYGDKGLIYDAQGCITKVYLGQGEETAATCFALAASNLPAGIYDAGNHLSHQILVQWILAQYCFTRYRAKEILPRQLLAPLDMQTAALREASMVYTVRDLINAPTNDMTPADLSLFIETLAKKHKAEFRQWVGSDLIEENFPAIYTVGRASIHPPRLISLQWGNPHYPKVTLVGKGVCFDSGGLDIKPFAAMRLMKKDMGGAACAIGLAQWIIDSELPVRLHLLIPAVENAIGPDAYRPGDVLRMRNGLTVEIDNTDAEGRLILADALVFACEEHPDLLIDFSTLTGAARVAVGTDISAMFTPDDKLAADIALSADKACDPIWRLPLHQAYRTMLDSKIADLANASNSSYAGAITAALFLQRFVIPNVPWIHFDMMAWNLVARPGKPEGGEAMAVSALAHYLEKRFRAEIPGI